jgi:hypothetical protein
VSKDISGMMSFFKIIIILSIEKIAERIDCHTEEGLMGYHKEVVTRAAHSSKEASGSE